MSHRWTKEEGNTRGWLYTFKRGNGAVVLNRLDEVIHEAPTFAEAERWANANYAAIDEPLTRKHETKKAPTRKTAKRARPAISTPNDWVLPL